MADNFLTIEEVCEDLQLTRDQVMTLVKQGALRGFRDQNTYKFRASEVARYKEQIEGGATVMLDGKESGEVSPEEVTEIQMPVDEDDKSDTSKIDLADIESETGADESDQTSVLAPVDEEEDESTKEEEPAFEFSEEDLGLMLDDDTAESVLVADESESSVDILDTIEETSSESATSTTDIELADESSSEEITTVADMESTDAGAPKEEHASDIVELEESSDEELDTIDLEQPVEAADVAAVEAPLGETIELGEVPGAEAPATETVETIPLDSEPETVGIVPEDDTQLSAAEEPEGVLTEDVLGEGMLAAEGMAETEEPSLEAELEEAPVVAGGWDLVVPSAFGNAALIAAIVLLGVGGALLICEMGHIDNEITRAVVDFINQYAPKQ